MRPSDQGYLRRSLTAIAAVVAGFTVAALVLAYVLTSYEYESNESEGRTELAAGGISRLAYAQPDTWMYQDKRLSELLTRVIPLSALRTQAFSLRILDRNGAVIVALGAPPPWPTITTRAPVTDGFTVVGSVELSENVNHIWLHAVPASLIGLFLALAIFVVLRVLPLRALLKREAALEAAQNETRESERQLRLVSDAMPVLIGYIDAAEHLRVINKTGEDWFARPCAELLGRSLHEFLPKEVNLAIRADVAKALSGEPVSFERPATYSDGIARRVRGRYIPHIGPDGQVLGYFAFIEDVTDQRETEELLRQAQKTEALGQLTGGIAHDFNNILGIVVGNIEMLREQHLDDVDSLMLIDAALNASLRGGELTQRLLAFSRKQVLAPSVISANDLIANVAVLLRRTIASSIHIETVLADDLWPAVVDASQLENAVVNLSINARDAMPAGGKLTIETANMEICGDVVSELAVGLAPGSYVTVTVSDNGTGMPADVLEHVFEPFFTTKDVGKGSGLGLSMVYGFAKQSGGQVKIYSEAGEGTSARIYLPRAAADEDTAGVRQPTTSEMPVGRGETILVVEDAEDLRQVAVAHLQSLGYTVLHANNGQSALTLMTERPDIDLLFTDIVLPDGLHGGELARLATARRPALKVLFTSGYTRNAAIHQGRLEAGVRLLDKPYRKHDLARRVRAALDAPADQRESA